MEAWTARSLSKNSRRWLDENAAAIRRIGHAANPAGLLEAVHHPGRRACREPRHFCEPAHGQAALILENLQALHVGAGKPETFGDGLAENRRLAALLTDGPKHRRYEFVSRITA